MTTENEKPMAKMECCPPPIWTIYVDQDWPVIEGGPNGVYIHETEFNRMKQRAEDAEKMLEEVLAADMYVDDVPEKLETLERARILLATRGKEGEK